MGIAVVKRDVCSVPDPLPFWHAVGADRVDGKPEEQSTSLAQVTPSRIDWFASGGPGNRPFRRLRVLPGDECFGERCELGNNGQPTFFVYAPETYSVTRYHLRLGPFPLDTRSWQVVTQFKQVQPHPREDTNGSPILAIEANEGRWWLKSSGEKVLQGPPAALARWTFLSLKVRWSLTGGRVQFIVDDWRSEVRSMRTLKFAAEAGRGFAAGDPIPCHLRIGPYHATGLPEAVVDVANVRVLA